MLANLLAYALASLLALHGSPGGAPARAQATDGEFERVWYDGQAEVSGYRWRGSRYGEMRAGEAVAIFVTETIGAKEHVKVDRPEEYRGETLTVLKLNLVRDFQTGLYDYNTMVTAFADVDTLRPVKQTFSSAEWCGHVYETLDVRGQELALDVQSYFQGESAQTTLPMKADGIPGEHLFVWLRGLRGHALAAGETRKLAYLADPFERRLRHAEASWGELTVAREAQSASASVPAGNFAALVYRLTSSDGRTGSVQIEEAYPHRLLSWSWTRGGEELDVGELAGSQRMKYWDMHGAGQESLRKQIGLE